MLRFKRTNITYISIHTSCRRRRFIVKGTQDRRVHVCICLLSSAVDMIDAPTYTHASPPPFRVHTRVRVKGQSFWISNLRYPRGAYTTFDQSFILLFFFLFSIIIIIIHNMCVRVFFNFSQVPAHQLVGGHQGFLMRWQNSACRQWPSVYYDTSIEIAADGNASKNI